MRSVGLCVAAVIVLASGVWLTRSGPPYGTGLLNVHKLVDVVAMVVIGIVVYRANATAPLSGSEWLIVGGAAVLGIAALATGGVVSGMKEAPAAALWVHRIGSWVAAVLLVASYVVVAGR